MKVICGIILDDDAECFVRFVIADKGVEGSVGWVLPPVHHDRAGKLHIGERLDDVGHILLVKLLVPGTRGPLVIFRHVGHVGLHGRSQVGLGPVVGGGDEQRLAGDPPRHSDPVNIAVFES